MSAPGWAHSHLRRRDAVALVVAVLAAHIWLLAGSPQWLMSASDHAASTHAFETRHIIQNPPASPRVSRVASAPGASPGPYQAGAPAASPLMKPHDIEDVVSDWAAPVALPEKAAASVDLPPFNRSVAGDSVVEPTAFRPPPSATLEYNVTGKLKQFHYSANGELSWQQNGQTYEARLEISAFLLGSRTQTSSGSLGVEGLMPTRFGDKTRSELAAHFQREKGIISFSANTPDAPLLKGAQDRLSIVLQLSALLAADPQRFPTGTMLSMQTVSQREAEVWQFGVEKAESLDLPYGNVMAIKLNRKPRREFDQHIEIWFAPTLDYLPVRLRITNANGDQVDQMLRALDRPSQ